MRPALKYLAWISGAGLVLAALLVVIPAARTTREVLPPTYSDAEFWNLVQDFSEVGGYFRSDNFVSNETTFQHVIPELRRRTKPGGVYLGVGPDQNFSYIVALRPQLAFVVDIRRQNMLLHLMYKSIIEMSETRDQFLAMLFCRPLHANADPGNPSTAELFAALDKRPPDRESFERNYRDIIERLTTEHRFALTPDDLKTIHYVYEAFFTAGPDIRYSFPSQNGWRPFPSYADLMLQSDLKGENHSYLATEDNFQALRQMEIENRLVPLVGDFAGGKALRSVGKYLTDHSAAVTAFYTSNVEFYLFQSDDWRKFFDNVNMLPMDSNSVFIRAFFDNQGLRYTPSNSGLQPITLLDGMSDLVSAVRQGRVRSYDDLVRRSW